MAIDRILHDFPSPDLLEKDEIDLPSSGLLRAPGTQMVHRHTFKQNAHTFFLKNTFLKRLLKMILLQIIPLGRSLQMGFRLSSQ